MISTKTAALIGAAALSVAPVYQSSAGQFKVGSVDMKKVFDSYYKTKDAESKINVARSTAKKEMDERMDLLKKAMDEIKKLDEELQNPVLSKEEKDRKSKVRSDKAAELQNMDHELREFQVSREKQLQEQARRMRSGIVEDINRVVDERVKAGSYNLVLDKSGQSLNDVPIVLFSSADYEFTGEVISILNKGKATSSASGPGATPAAKQSVTAPAKK
jgi:Skp family chaperone for outer membrane proteins